MACTFRSVIGLGFMVAALAACDDSSSGSGNNPGTGGGNTGTGGGDGSGGGGNTGGPPAGSIELAPENGWVDGASNTVGIQGALFTFKDDSGESSISPDDFATAGAELCVSGVGAKVDLECGEADCYGFFWGAGVGFNLNQPPEDPPGSGGNDPEPYDATSVGVTGFYFEIEGDTIPSDLRFKAKVAGDDSDYCVRNLQAGGTTVDFAELKKSCWAAETGSVDTTKIEAIQWQVSTSDSAERPFNFCIKNIHAVK